MGSHLGVVVTDYQPMKIASTEAQWDTCQPCAFSLFQIGGFTKDDPTPSFSIQIPKLLSVLATGSPNGKVEGINELQAQEAAAYGPGDYTPPIRTAYWSMRIMAYLGTLVFLVFAVGAFLLLARAARDDALVPVDGRADHPLAVPLRARRLGALRGRSTALDRLGAAEDRRCQLAERQLDDRSG